MSAPGWVLEVFKAVDSRDSDAFVTFLTDDCSFVYASQPPVTGKEAIREGVAAFFGTIAGLKHEVLRCWTEGNTTISQLSVEYTRLDNNAQVTVPAVTIWNMTGEKIKDYLIYIDLTPVYAPME